MKRKSSKKEKYKNLTFRRQPASAQAQSPFKECILGKYKDNRKDKNKGAKEVFCFFKKSVPKR